MLGLVASAAICVAADGSFAASENDVGELKRLVLEQQRKFAEQEKRLAIQEKRLAEQEQRLAEQRRRLAEQQSKLATQERLAHQQGLILTLQDQDIYELRDKVRSGAWPTGSTTYGNNGVGKTTAAFGASPYARSARQNDPGIVLTGTVSPQAPLPVPPDDAPPVPPSGAPPTPPQPPSTVPAPQPGDQARPKSEKAPEQLLVEAGGVLLPPGTLQIEPGVEYSRFSSDRLQVSGLSIFDAIIIGFIRADDLDRDVVRTNLTTRLGLFRRVQGDVRISGVYREDRETLGVGTAEVRERSSSNLDLGDTTVGLSFQPLLGRGIIPDTIIRLDGTLPTGESPFDIPTETIGTGGGESRLVRPPTGGGFYAAGATATFVWTSDPVVFFAGGGYTFNLERTFDQFGTIDPGDTFRFFGGMNVALSDRVSLNLSFADSITGTTIQNDMEVPNTTTNDARVSIGASIGVSPGTSLLVSTSIGLTEESPDFVVSVSVPLTFRGLY